MVRRLRYGVARHLHGLGGEDGLDRMYLEEIRDLFEDFRSELEKEAERAKRLSKMARAGRR